MDMDLSLLVMPQPKIKVEEDSDIIDLDNDKTLEDLVYEWDARVCTKLKNYSIIETEEALDTLMKWYIQSLKDEAMSLEDFKNLKGLVKKHIQFFKLYFTQLNCCFGDNFLDNMEEIMSFYVDVELKSVLKKSKNVAKAYQKYLSSLCRKMVCMMNLYLMNNEEHIYHILMKIKVNLLSEESKDLVNLLYRTFLTNPKDKSDMAFCRGYILYQKWKIFRKPNEWEKMDEVMYKLYDQTPDSVRNNEILKPILFPQSNSILDSLTHITEKYVIICNEYFKYRKSMKVQEQSVILPELGDISLNDSIFPELIYDEEDREFNNAYNTFVQSMAALSKKRDNKVLDTSTAIEIDDDDDDDCQIIGISTLNHCSEELDLVHEVLDDDDGIEMIYFKKKEPQINPLEQKKTKSFLDMIDLSNHIEQPERPERFR